MERVESDSNWTLFDPYKTPILHELYGDDFKKQYELFEKDKSLNKKTVSAKQLWKDILREYFETGMPFLGFKDTANRANPNKHEGIIRSSNLCMEIFQNTSPNTYKVEIRLENGEIFIVDEMDTFIVNDNVTKFAKEVTTIDSIEGSNVIYTGKKRIDGNTAVCNLASINLSKINTHEDIERVTPIAIRMLDNVVDLNFYPLDKVRQTSLLSRAIGLGVMGEAEMLAENEIHWGSREHFDKIDTIMEAVNYNVIRSSMLLAKEKGSYKTFKGSEWSKGNFPMDKANKAVNDLVKRQLHYDWKGLKKDVKENGIRNGYLQAIAPTSSISIFTGTTQTIEPIYKKKWYEENLSGLTPNVVPGLSAKTWNYYISAYDVDPISAVKAAAIRQKWVDQGQSLNVFLTLDKASGKLMNEIYMTGWKLDIKSFYYLRTESPEALIDEEAVMDRSIECINCQ